VAATELLYLQDFDVTTCNAKVVETRTHEDGRAIIVLDQTCFYPRGGGQDWDTGVIAKDGDRFVVEEVRLDEHGTVLHIGQPAMSWQSGTEVTCHVNEDRRAINTRLHSAGHLLDMVMSGLKPNWVPGKGAHYPHMSFVEYEVGEDTAGEELQHQLQAGINKYRHDDKPSRILFVPIGDMAKYCRHVPTNVPTNKPSRIVIYGDDFGVPCGGTHVRTLQQIGNVTITKIKVKKGVAKVSYTIEGVEHATNHA
jgi:Ser-tRNA(Ala) deacylase AlaX